MFNPYAILSPKLLDAFVKSGKRYYVRQTFQRGLNKLYPDIKAAFLMSQYSDSASAEAHFNAMEGDGNRFLYDWENEEHRNRLIVAARNPPGFLVYANVWENNWKSLITPELRIKARDFVERVGWKPTREGGLRFEIYTQFGEPYAMLKLRNNQEIRVKLADIENG